MTDCIIAVPSMTMAQKAGRVLSSHGLSARVVNIDPSITKHGCGYGISISCRDLAEAKRILDRKRVHYGDVIGAYGGDNL